MSDKARTMTRREQEALNLAAQIDDKVVEALEPLRLLMEKLNYPQEFKLLMWETVARKAKTYAARHA